MPRPLRQLIETMRVRNGHVPFLERHLRRLARSAAALGVAVPEDLEARVLAARAGAEGVLRVVLGDAALEVEARPVPEQVSGRLALAREPYVAYPHKTTDRERFDRAHREAGDAGAVDAVFLADGGLLAEGAITSVFGWIGEALWTPPLSLGILPGVGRSRVLDVAQELGVPVLEELLSWDEVKEQPLFLVNAVRGVIEPADSPRDQRTALVAARFWG
ncbi:MAG TPA: aminotransferase class IV [Gemmatimonadales bacterium]|nr:aminotransferase class IV [Gemmatimonadales bacterium]